MIRAIRSMIFKRGAAAIFAAVIVLAPAVFLCIKFKGSFMLKQFQYFVQYKAGKALDAEVSIDSISPRLAGPTVIKGFSVVKDTGDDTPFIFKSDRLVIYNNMYQVLADRVFKKIGFKGVTLVFKIDNGSLSKGEKPIFQNINGFGKIVNNNLVFDDISGKCYNFPLSIHGKVSGKTSKIDLNIESVSEKLRGKVHLSDYVLRPHAVGVFELNSGYKFYFSGDIGIRPGESVSFENLMLQNRVFARSKIDFLKKKFYAELKKKPSGSEPGASKDVIQLVGDFSKKDYLDASVFFDHVALGRVDLQSQLDIKLDFTDTNSVKGNIKTSGTILDFRPFSDLEGDFSVEKGVLKIGRLVLGEDYDLAGTIELHKPHKIDLALRGRKGKLGTIDYETMVVNLSGNSPVLKVVDSRILRKQGYIDLSGEVDLRRLWSQQPANGLRWTCGNEAIVWQGWDIVKQANSKDIEMGKAVGKEKEFMVTFKSYLNDEQSWQDSQGHKQDQAVAVKYNLDEQKSVNMQIKNSEEVFSLEHKARF